MQGNAEILFRSRTPTDGPHCYELGYCFKRAGSRGLFRLRRAAQAWRFVLRFDVVRGKFPFDQLKDKIIEGKQRYGRAALVIEESPISHGLIQSLREKHVNVVDIKPDRDKLSRLISQIDLFESGSVLLPKDAPWLDAFVSELLSFPGRHDDQVDALSQGLAWGREAWRRPPTQRRTIGMGG